MDEKADEEMKHDVNDTITEEQWVLEQMQLKKCETFAGGQVLWKTVMADDSYMKEWHVASQQWLLKTWRGTRSLAGSRQSKSNRLVKEHDIEDAEDLKAAGESNAARAAASAAWLKRVKGANAAGAHENGEELQRLGQHDVGVASAVPVMAPEDNALSKRVRETVACEAAERSRMQ